jgi:tRNA threonylcarbamoyladenosine biosynthesis protein TsaE
MGAAVELATSSAEETRALGVALAPLLAPGDVVSLTGDLGAGKTTLVQGVARGLGVDQPVLSPTFTLVRQYEGIHPVYHLDIYRLDRVQDVLDLGFEELLDAGGVVLIEWGDAIEALLPDEMLEVELSIDDADERRQISVTGRGRSWARRWPGVESAVAGWAVA